jgi:hypothetical protein
MQNTGLVKSNNIGRVKKHFLLKMLPFACAVLTAVQACLVPVYTKCSAGPSHEGMHARIGGIK